MKKKQIVIALTTIAALVILFFGMNFLKGLSFFQSQDLYYVTFNNVSGLEVNTPVYADGVRVGNVGRIIYDYTHASPTRVELWLQKELRLPKGSAAEVKSDLMGNTQVNLLLAPNPRERVLPGESIQGSDGDGTMERLKAMLPAVEQMVPKLDSILYSLNLILSDPAIVATLHNVQNISANLTTTSHELNQMMAQLNASVPTLVAKADNALDNAATVANNLAQVDVAGIEQQAKKTLAGVETTLNEAQQTIASLNKTVENLHSITENLNNGEGSLGLLLNDTQLYDNLNRTATSADRLLRDLQDHPKRYVHFSLFGKKDKPAE